MTASIQSSRESRGLGTREQSEHTRAEFASVAFAGETAASLRWNSVIYANVREASRTFGAVNFGRTTEIPVINQLAEPVRVFGISWTGAWNHVEDARTNFGIDLRTTDGETRSLVDFSDGLFTREIITGAEETSVGLFAIHHRRLSSTVRGMLGVRLDSLRETDRQWRETNRTSGARLDVPFSRSSNVEFSPSVGLVWNRSNTLRLRATAQQSFRQPTMAERYRVFGQRNQVLEPNPQVKTEHTVSAEMSIEYSPTEAMTVTTRLFASEFRDSPGSHSVANEIGQRLVFDVLPQPVEHRRRITLDRARTRGVEISVAHRRAEKISWESGLRLQGSEILHATQSPRFEHNELPGLARVVAFTQGTWRTSPKFSLQARLRWLGREFVNEENSRRIGATVILDSCTTYALTAQTSLFVEAENLGNVVAETSRSSDGVVFARAPRRFSGGVRVTW